MGVGYGVGWRGFFGLVLGFKLGFVELDLFLVFDVVFVGVV